VNSPEVGREALRLLTVREHSRAELRNKLLARGFDPRAVDRLLSQLEEKDLLSDERFVASYAESRVRRGFGPRRIVPELRQKGVAQDLIDRHLRRSPEQWLNLIAAVHDKKYGGGRPRDFKERARRARFLEYRGFEPELVRRFLRHEDEC
jgi:regulatory protein